MRFKFLILPSVLMFQLAEAQNGPASLSTAQGTTATTAPAPPSAEVTQPVSTSSPASPIGQTAIMDYQSVYDAATLEEEVKMAAERFALTPAQQEMWMTAAVDRRQTEKQAREKLDSKAANYEKDGVYRGLRSAQNTFYETIIGYLTPTQKQALETDRTILEEKRKRLAKLPPPPPPAPTVTVAPVDSSAIKEPETGKKGKGAKKAKKKKKAVMQ